MYDDLTAEELIEWELAYAVDPWGPEREETLIGVLCSLIDACHRTKGRAEPPLHYMPFVKNLSEAKRPQQSEDDMKAVWQSVVAQWGKGEK